MITDEILLENGYKKFYDGLIKAFDNLKSIELDD